MPAQTIGAAVGLSAAAVQRRLAKMRTSGVIVREAAEIDPSALGYPLTCIVGVDLEQERRSDLEAFKKRMRRHPQVQQCYYVTGAVDFVLVVLAKDTQAYEAFTQAALLADPNVRAFTTYVTLDRVKVGLDVP